MAKAFGPRYFGVKLGSLAKAKARLKSGDQGLARALGTLLAEADETLRSKPVSVTETSKTPPSGDKHDYFSLAPYY